MLHHVRFIFTIVSFVFASFGLLFCYKLMCFVLNANKIASWTRLTCSNSYRYVYGEFVVNKQREKLRISSTKQTLECSWVTSWTRNMHSVAELRPRTNSLTPKKRTVCKKETVLLSSLHIKLRLVKEYVMAFPREGKCFTYLCWTFLGVSYAKIKEEVLVCLDLKKSTKDENVYNCLGETAYGAWINFKNGIKIPCAIIKVQTTRTTLEECWKCNMNIKVHFLHAHPDHFP